MPIPIVHRALSKTDGTVSGLVRGLEISRNDVKGSYQQQDCEHDCNAFFDERPGITPFLFAVASHGISCSRLIDFLALVVPVLGESGS